MTVRELFSALQTLPQDSAVLLTWDGEAADGLYRVSEETEDVVMDRFGVEFDAGKSVAVLWGDNAD